MMGRNQLWLFVLIALATESSSSSCKSTFNSAARPVSVLSRVVRGGDVDDDISSDEIDSLSKSIAIKSKRRRRRPVGDEDKDMDIQSEDIDEEQELDGGDMGHTATSIALSLTKRTLTIVGKAVLLTYERFRYATDAALRSSGEEDEQSDKLTEGGDISATSLIMKSAGKFLRALLEGPESVAVETSMAMRDKGKTTNNKRCSNKLATSFRSFLRSSYGEIDTDALILDDSLSESLKKCRSSARLLVVFIPSQAAPKKDKREKSLDTKAVRSLCSDEVATVAEYKGGSYYFWGCVGGNSGESSSAIKRIRATAQKSIPVLAVIYPAQVRDRLAYSNAFNYVYSGALIFIFICAC